MGILRTEPENKDFLMKLINFEIYHFFNKVKNDHLDIRFGDLLKDYVRFLWEGFNLNNHKKDGFLVNYLNIMRGYFIFEGIQIYLVEDGNFLNPFLEFSKSDIFFNERIKNKDFIELAQVICTDQKKLYIENCEDNEFLKTIMPDIEFKFENFIVSLYSKEMKN